MSLDIVHDIQTAYRSVLDSLSRPGVVSNLTEQASRVDIESGCFEATLILALMLLDTEVTFAVVADGEQQELVTRLFNQLTYAKSVEIDQADYAFVLSSAKAEQLEAALEMAKTGELINPHESATIVVEADLVSQEKGLVLRGPGIETETVARVERSGEWLRVRAEKNEEFPLGIDILFVDREHRLLGLPRTTKVEQVIE
ncbi:phosphonate C-P lyase system protein PhnH [Brevibacillus choshinensis]|uniref:Phosphonate C-P lyase system protein PhnH n=1 Tax=Brevibacillus choshinensis TaxID=54911 RepID=A0ABX7FVP9_BRECH|nr:phosphonate C-P lyase system protein PhnH [Brevibacillus choshinensis]QRG69070.1 phosphonate C-P lyase system protein PhnH [Brevibacillus choshinensis]